MSDLAMPDGVTPQQNEMIDSFDELAKNNKLMAESLKQIEETSKEKLKLAEEDYKEREEEKKANEKGKAKPKIGDIVKTGKWGLGFLYLAEQMGKGFESMTEKGGLFDKLKGGFGKLLMKIPGVAGIASIFSKSGIMGGMKGLMKLGPQAMAGPLMIATGVIMGIIDGIKGIFKADEWGTSKVGAFIGGFLGGTAEKGVKRVMGNMGKWALIGAGIGMVGGGGIVGGIVGGLVGAIIGGVLGAIGGKELAQGADKVMASIKAWVKGAWANIKEFAIMMFQDVFKPVVQIFKDFGNNVANIFLDKETTMGQKVGKLIGEALIKLPIRLAKWVIDSNVKIFNWIFKKIVNSPAGKKASKQLGGNLLEVIVNVGKAVGGAIWKGIKGYFKFYGQMISGVFESLMDSPVGNQIGESVSSIFNWVGNKFNEAKEWSMEKFNSMNQKVGDFFNSIGKFFDFIGYAFKNPGELISALKSGGISGAFESYLSRGSLEAEEQERRKSATVGYSAGSSGYNPYSGSASVNDAIITKTGDVIHTHPDDNIIATKNNPTMMMEGGSNGMVQAIERLGNKLEQLKPNVVSQTNNITQFASVQYLKSF